MDYRIETKAPLQIIGRTKRMTTVDDAHYHEIGTFWREWDDNGLYRQIGEKYSSDKTCHVVDVSTPAPKTEEFDYTIGFPYNGAENEDGLNIVTIPGGAYAVFRVPDASLNDMGGFMHRIITEYLPSLGHQLLGVDAEYFSDAGAEAWFLIK